MQSLLLATTLLTFLTLVAGWKMTANYNDGVTSKFHGHINSGCTEFKKTDAKITSVNFNDSMFASKFVLYRDSNCQNESYKGEKGGNNVPNQVYRSYKVY